MMTPKKMWGKVESKANLAGNNWLISFVFEEPVEFLAGQYLSFKVSEAGHRRSYSIANLPGENKVDLLVDVSPMGMGSKYMLDLTEGEVVEVLGPLGNFVVEEETTGPLLFVATGTGIAPLKPMVEDLLRNKHCLGKVKLIWGMRYEKDLYWTKEIESLSREYSNFDFDLTLSRPEDNWLGQKGRVGGIIDQLEWKWSESAVYLCGSTTMIEEMKVKLQNKGVLRDNIYYEKFF